MQWLDLRSEARVHRPVLPMMPHLTASARATWLGRMVNEYASARVFEGLAEQLAAAGFDAEVVETCRGFAAEERMHGILCGGVVEALGGEARADLQEREAFPAHEDVGPLEGALRNLLSISCLSETVAVALIGAERLEMPEGALRDLLTRIYSDEVGHARFGWKLLADLVDDDAPAARHGQNHERFDAPMRARLGEYLTVAFAHLERHELAHLPEHVRPPPEGVALGLCSGSDARVLFYETVNEVIVAGLEALGIPAEKAWAARTFS